MALRMPVRSAVMPTNAMSQPVIQTARSAKPVALSNRTLDDGFTDLERDAQRASRRSLSSRAKNRSSCSSDPNSPLLLFGNPHLQRDKH